MGTSECKNNYQVIVVDDDVMVLTAARNLLKDNGMRVNAVRSGRELLTYIKKNTPNIILLDLMMPEMDGFETYKKLREFEEAEGRRPTPVIFLTGNMDSESELQALSMGASDFIRKPFVKDIFLSRIKNIVAKEKTIDSLMDEATIDGLTGFINKANAVERLGSLCRSENGMLTMIDLDNFKLVNDLYGHDMGDQVLKAFSDIIRKRTRRDDVVCRIGGDEFCAFLKGISDPEAVGGLTHRLNEGLAEACRQLMGEDFHIPIGVSVGAVPVPDSGTEYDELFRLADKMLYQVKENGKHSCAVYSGKENSDESGEPDIKTRLFQMMKLVEERNETPEPMMVGREPFMWAYRYLLRFLKNMNESGTKMMISLKSTDEEREAFNEAVKEELRSCDLIFEVSDGTFFALLPGVNVEEAGRMLEGVRKRWICKPKYERGVIEYATDSV